MKKSLLTFILPLLFFIGCTSTKVVPKPEVKPHLPLHKIIGVDSAYTASWTDFMGTKYQLGLTNNTAKVSRKLNPSSAQVQHWKEHIILLKKS